MEKITRSSERGSKQKSPEKVEMIIRTKNVHAGMGHEVMAHRRSFILNLPSEDIVARYSIIERKNQAKMTNEQKARFLNGI
jgi:uncharacterized membrane protein